MQIPHQDYVFIADESGITNVRYTVVGGVSMHCSEMQSAYDRLRSFRLQHQMFAELKWSKVSRQKVEYYIKLVDIFFELLNEDRLQFHCLIFDSHKWNHAKYNQGNRDVGLSKLYYQLILHKFVKMRGNKGTLFVRLDHRNSSTSLESIRKMLNTVASRDLRMHNQPVKQLTSIDSKLCDILQMNDVILGAVCALRNATDDSDKSRPKFRLARRMADLAGITDFGNNTPYGSDRFTVWNMQPRR